jgi:hypothetical protein
MDLVASSQLHRAGIITTRKTGSHALSLPTYTGKGPNILLFTASSFMNYASPQHSNCKTFKWHASISEWHPEVFLVNSGAAALRKLLCEHPTTESQ